MVRVMRRIINRFLLIIVISLVSLLVYRTLRPVPRVSSTIVSTSAPSHEQSGENLQEKVEPIIKEYLANNPEIIIDAVEQFQKKKIQEMDLRIKDYIHQEKSEIENANHFPTVGNDQGDITIVSFYDYNCSYCRKSNIYLNQLLSSDPKVKVILRPFPVLGESSMYAAKIALAVNNLEPAKFKAVHEAMMTMATISKDSIAELLHSNNIDSAKVIEEADKIEVKNMINKNFDLASNLKIRGAPATIINGQLLAGLLDFDSLKDIISNIRAAKE